MAVLITFAELAALKGCSKPAVTAAVRSGRIAAAVVEKDGKRWLDRDLALQLWTRNTRATHNALISRPDPIEATPPADAAQLRQWVQQLPAEAIPDLHESRARREHFQAELAAMQVAQQRGELVSAAEMKAAAFKEARTARDRLMAVPSRLASELASCSDPRQCHLMLAEEIRVCLKGLSDAPEQQRQNEPIATAL